MRLFSAVFATLISVTFLTVARIHYTSEYYLYENIDMKIKKTVMAAIVAAVGRGAFAADVGVKVNGTVDLAVPVKDEKGFYILKSK